MYLIVSFAMQTNCVVFVPTEILITNIKFPKDNFNF